MLFFTIKIISIQILMVKKAISLCTPDFKHVDLSSVLET